MAEKAFQDEIKGNHCWGCSSTNPGGLRIKSHWSEGGSVCVWRPEEIHSAGPKSVLNGGIIASLIDCHCICTAIADGYKEEGREIGSGEPIWYATGTLKVTYKRPTPVDGQVTLRAQITEKTERKTVLSCTVVAEGEECAVGEIVAIRVPPDWLES
jgi:acyl-coenzyme A thioesterase PaaI-like protein